MTITELDLASMLAVVGKLIDAERHEYVNDDWGQHRYRTALDNRELRTLEDLHRFLDELEPNHL